MKTHLRNLLGLEWEQFTLFILSDSSHLALVELQYPKDILCLTRSLLPFYLFFLKHVFVQFEKLFKAVSFSASNTPTKFISTFLSSSPIGIMICLSNTQEKEIGGKKKIRKSFCFTEPYFTILQVSILRYLYLLFNLSLKVLKQSRSLGVLNFFFFFNYFHLVSYRRFSSKYSY